MGHEDAPGRHAAPTGSIERCVSAIAADPLADLRKRDLMLPVHGIKREDLRDTFNDMRGGTRRHEAIDVLAPRHTPVLAVEDGTVARLFSSEAGGMTIYQFDPTERLHLLLRAPRELRAGCGGRQPRQARPSDRLRRYHWQRAERHSPSPLRDFQDDRREEVVAGDADRSLCRSEIGVPLRDRRVRYAEPGLRWLCRLQGRQPAFDGCECWTRTASAADERKKRTVLKGSARMSAAIVIASVAKLMAAAMNRSAKAHRASAQPQRMAGAIQAKSPSSASHDIRFPPDAAVGYLCRHRTVRGSGLRA